MSSCGCQTMRKLTCALILVLLAGCQSVAPSRQLDFKLDNGATQTFDFTKRGALPADNGIYKVEGLGLMLYQHPQSKHAYFAWDVVVNVKAQAVSKITVSQVLNNGGLQTLLLDARPQRENGEKWRQLGNGGKVNVQAARWHAVSAGRPVSSAAWLHDTQQNSMFVFKIEIEDGEHKQHVLYQPMVISADSKAEYAKVIAAIK